MTKLLHSNKMILNRIYLLVSSSGTRVNSSTTTTGNQNDKSTLFEPHIEPVTLAYSSYETTSSEITAAPVIIMHGLFGSKKNWRNISKALHAKSKPVRKIIAIDSRNHGESPHVPNHRYEDLAEDIHEFYRQHNLSRAVVIGHSMGGRAMMTFALKHPELVEKAVIVDVSPVTTKPALKNMSEIFTAMLYVKIENGLSAADGRAIADEQIKEFIAEKVTRDFILMNLYRSVDGSFKWYINIDALQNYRSNLVAFPEYLKKYRYTGPILFLGGSRSPLLKESQIPEIVNYFPGAKLKFLDGGHNIGLVDSRQTFLDEVASFINDIQ